MKKLLVLALSAILLISGLPANAGVKAGAVCKTSGQVKISGGKEFTCIKLGSKLYWGNGKKILKKNSSATPKVKGALPRGVETFFGKGFVLESECWFAKKFVNESNDITIAAEQFAQVISPEGTIMFTIKFEVPSMKPKSEFWSVSWQPITNDCYGGIGKIIESEVKVRDFVDFYNVYTRNLQSNLNEIPTLLSVVKDTGKFPDSHIYKLKVRNNSTDKTLMSSNYSRISFVFLNSSGVPIYASTGRIVGAVPPNGEATLSGWDFELGSIKSVPGVVSIEGSLIYELCRGVDCTY